MNAAEIDRSAGALVGLAAGDALGAGYEFQDSAPARPEMIGGGPFGWEPGEWTDDTQMAICIAEITETGSSDPLAIGNRFLNWYRSRPQDVGIQTRAVLGAATDTAELTELARRYFEANPHNAAGNGSLMRTAPVALANLGDEVAIAKSALAVSDLTHGDPLAGEACVLWCIGIDRAIRERRLDGVGDGIDLLPASSRVRWRSWLDEAEANPPATFKPNGFVVPALQAAYAAVTQTPVPEQQHCRHLEDALCTAVSIGNDTDTVGAIAGSLLGARWGTSAIPLRWRSLLHGWPGFKARDLVRLAVMTARSGPDAAGWPTAKRLLPYYRSNFDLPEVSTPLPEDPRVVVGDVGGLGTQEVDVVVSLCRMGTEDVPSHVEHHEIFLLDSDRSEDNPNLECILLDLVNTIRGWVDDGQRVFVHCVRAENRTPLVAAAYLASTLGVSGSEALQHVITLLPTARPTPAFVSVLTRLCPGRPETRR